jgi:hypothetical protein
MVDHMSRPLSSNSSNSSKHSNSKYNPRTGCGTNYSGITESRGLLEHPNLLTTTAENEELRNTEYSKFLEELQLYGRWWTTPVNLFERGNTIGMRCGVYAIFHIDDGLCYVGHSKMLGGRRYTHSRFFRRGGETYVSPNGSTAGSAVAKKMFKRDSDEESWMFSYILIDSPRFSRAYEKRLIETLDPVFNAKGWAGI